MSPSYARGSFAWAAVCGICLLNAAASDWNGRLWVVIGSDAAADRLAVDGAEVVRHEHRLEVDSAGGTNAWRETGYLRVHRLVAEARKAFAAKHGAAPQFTYFLGVGREGGNAALHEAQQFPEDVDGVVAIGPEIAPAAGRSEGEFLNAANPDLHAFRRRGGKLVLRAPRTGASAGRLSGYRDRVFETEGSALRAGRYFAFAFSDGPDDAEALSAAKTLVSWRERGILPRENAAYDDTPAAATATADRYSWRTHTLAEAHGDASAPEDPFDYIQSELAKGKKSILVPTARYEVAPKVKLDDGSFAYLILAGLNDVTIDFGGSELVGKLRTRVMDCRNCSNLTIKNLTVDFAVLPFTQGEIVKVDGEGTWDVRILDGYPAPEPTGEKGESASHDDFWPMQAYDARTTDWVNPMRFQDGIKLEKTGERTYRISGGGDRTGKVGDIAVWSVKDRSHAVVGETFVFHDCPQLTCADVTLFSTPHGRAFYEFNPNASVFSGCRIIRRPPETDLCRRAMRRLRSGNHDGIISKAGVKGPRIEDCQFTYHCDDCVNISGQYSVFSRKEGRKWRILDNWVGIRPRVGSKLQILTFDGRTLTNEVTVLANVDAGPATDEERKFMTYEAGIVFGHGKSVRHASELTVDSDVDPGRYAAIVSDTCLGNGFCITNCVFGYSRSRGLLIKASHGQVRDNLIVRTCGSALAVTTEYSWLSGGCASDLDIAGNTLWHAGRWLVSVGGDVGVGRKIKAELQPGAHHDIRLRGNRLVGSRGIQLEGCDRCLVRDNDFSVEDTKPGLRLWLRRSAEIDADVPYLKEP